MTDETMQVGPFLYQKVQEQSPRSMKNRWSVWRCPGRPPLYKTIEGWVVALGNQEVATTPEEALGDWLTGWTIEGGTYYLVNPCDRHFEAAPIPAIHGYPILKVCLKGDSPVWATRGGKWCGADVVLKDYWASRVLEASKATQTALQKVCGGLQQVSQYRALLGEPDGI